MACPLGHEQPARPQRNRRRRPQPNPLLCPDTALQVWQATLAGLLGRQPRSNEPVFVRLDRHLDPPQAITRNGASQIVKRVARPRRPRPRLRQPLLRAGFVSDAPDAGATREQVQRHGRWANIGSIDPYYRKTQTRGTGQPSQHLARHGKVTN